MSNDDEKAHDTEPTWACPVVSQDSLRGSRRQVGEATDWLQTQPDWIREVLYQLLIGTPVLALPAEVISEMYLPF